MFIYQLFENPLYYGLVVALVCFSICCHEYAHAWTALRVGDDTAAREGHLTLNPMVQMGGVSMVLMCVIGIAWGAVPVRRDRMRGRWSPALVSIAGPAMNVLLFLIFALMGSLVHVFMGDPKLSDFLFRIFLKAAMLNSMLAVFNMLPLPPLDGWHILQEFHRPLRDLDPQKQNMIAMGMLALLFLTPLGQVPMRLGAQLAAFVVSIMVKVLLLLTGGG